MDNKNQDNRTVRMSCGRTMKIYERCEDVCPSEPICRMADSIVKDKVYISIPITGHDVEAQRQKAISAADQYDKLLYIAKTPFDMDGWEPGHTWEWYMARCIRMVSFSDIIVMMPGWEKSEGCRLEHEYAKHIKIKIEYRDE